MLEFRTAVPEDWPAIWDIMEPVIRAGETYCWDTTKSEDAARREWLPGPTGSDPTLSVVVAVEAETTPGTGHTGGSGPARIVGTAQVHANRGGNGAHVANASFLVAVNAGGRGVGRALARHVLDRARSEGYTAMQFNAVVETNARAVALWTSLGFSIVGTVPGAFLHPEAGPTGLHVMHRFL
ncbi:GNAT family N-acetyltransferase [Vibrio cholerae]|nr:GNAT family N-acetyltransferase [Vibrio cholerae]